MARIGYIRVSTQEQNTARQDSMMTDCDKVFTEKISGKNVNRPELQRMMEYVREGDTVVVESYSRFSRSTKDLLELIEQLNDKGVAFVSLKENVDTSTPQGRLIMTIFSGLAQFEREQLLQRQKEGIAEAKKVDDQRRQQGLTPVKYQGRKPIDVDQGEFEKQYRAWKDGKQTATATMTALGLKANTFYRRVAEFEKDQK